MSWSTFDKFGGLKTGLSGALGWELVEKKAVSGGEVIFTDLDKYEAIELVSVDLNNASGTGESLHCQVSVDNGSTFLSTSIYSYQRIASQVTDSGVSTGGAQASTAFEFTGPARAMANDSGFGHGHTLRVFNMANAASFSPQFQSHFDYKTTNGAATNEQTWCRTTAGITGAMAGPMNAIRIYSLNNGNLSGSYILLGLPKTIKIKDQVVLPPNGWQTIETKIVRSLAGWMCLTRLKLWQARLFQALPMLAGNLKLARTVLVVRMPWRHMNATCSNLNQTIPLLPLTAVPLTRKWFSPQDSVNRE
jgi:hypothetical protein